MEVLNASKRFDKMVLTTNGTRIERLLPIMHFRKQAIEQIYAEMLQATLLGFGWMRRQNCQERNSKI
jgi:hypothetical protein